MRHVGTWSAVVLSLSAFAATGCGGGGHGFSVGSDPILITSNQLPPTLSGEIVNYPIPFTGGGGGPYLLELSSGTLPKGISFDNQTVALVGRALEDGTFHFTLRLTDTGTTPFSTTLMTFDWTIGIGALVFGTDTVLPSYVYNRFDSISLVVAGGTPPYACQVVDVASDPQDEPLPSGLSIPNGSCTIVGAPTGVKPGNPPFTYLVSVEAHDHADIPGYPSPAKVVKRFQINVLVPEVVITTLSVKNGTCGQPYADKIDIVDGIPPFKHSVVIALNDPTRLVGEPGTPGGLAKGSGPTAYPLETIAGPYTAKFPEGVMMGDATGQISGIPRRQGTFNSWIYYVQSNVLPAVPSQNKWKSYSFTMLDGQPPAVTLDTSVLVSGTFAAAGLGTIPSLEVGVPYRSGAGLQFKLIGGVPYDGRFDGPHETQALTNTEVVGTYNFAATTFASPGIPAGMSFSSNGKFSGTPLPAARGGFRNINLSASDLQLPLPLAATHKATGLCRYEVGPDTTIITETTSGSSAAVFDDTMDMNVQTVEVLEAFSSGAAVRALAAGDFAATTGNPTGSTLATTLSNIDFLRTSVNPTWWAYDVYNINARSARGMQHAAPERVYEGNAFGGDVQKQWYNSPSFNNGFEHSSNPAIELPQTNPVSPITVTHNPAAGVYTDGGLLYTFDNSTSNEFGFFIVRHDGKIFIPACFNKTSSGFTGLGDGWLVTGTTKPTEYKMPQITVSPDGRWAAAKLKVTVDNFAETAATERVLLFSLTGEKMFGGATFAVINGGGSGNTLDGQYFYGDTLTATNFSLYYLRGNNIGSINQSGGERVIFGEQWIYRATVFSPSTGAYLAPTGALLSPGFLGVGGWTNSSSNPLSSWHGRWMSPGSTTTGNYSPQSSWYPTNTSGGTTNTGSSMSTVSPAFFCFNYANFSEQAMAPMPFRVSANGHACAIIAGKNQPPFGNTSGTQVSTGTPHTDFLKYSIYVDYDNVFREASTAWRRYKPPTRIGGTHPGEEFNYIYGWFDGPATQLEISDNGAFIAAVYNASTTPWYTYFPNHMSNSDTREELVVLNGTGASTDPWSSKSESAVTANIFKSTFFWRYGCLAFTRNNTGLVFWGGYSLAYPDQAYYGYNAAQEISGSMYAYSLNTSNQVFGILGYADGGHIDVTAGSSKTYNTSTQNSYYTSYYNGDQGSIGPNGAFYSNDGNFFWVESAGALNTSTTTASRLVGTSVKDLTTTINGHAPQRAFAPNWPNYYGFDSTGHQYYAAIRWYGYGNTQGHVGKQISAGGSNGLVFFTSQLPYYADGNAQTSDGIGWAYYYGGGPAQRTAWYDFGANSGEVFGMDTSVGGAPFKLSNFGSATPGTTPTSRVISYMQPNNAGSALAIVSSATPAGFVPTIQANTEQLRVVTNIAVTTSGALTGVPPVVVIEGTNGRVSPSVAFDFTNSKLYYGFTTGGNENQMQLKEVTLNGTGTGVQGTRTFNGAISNSARFAVLWSGR